MGVEKPTLRGAVRPVIQTKYYSNCQIKIMRWAGHAASMGKRRGAYRILVWKTGGKGHLGDPGLDGRIILNESSISGVISGCKSGRCVGLTTLLHSCADSHEMWEPHPAGTLRVCPVCTGIAIHLSRIFIKSKSVFPTH